MASLKFLPVVLLGLLSLLASAAAEEPLYVHRADRATRWSSPENPRGEPGRAAIENEGAKGRAFVSLPAGATHHKR